MASPAHSKISMRNFPVFAFLTFSSFSERQERKGKPEGKQRREEEGMRAGVWTALRAATTAAAAQRWLPRAPVRPVLVPLEPLGSSLGPATPGIHAKFPSAVKLGLLQSALLETAVL